MTEAEYIDISNLARLRLLQSAVAWLLPTNLQERDALSDMMQAIERWEKAATKRMDGKVT